MSSFSLFTVTLQQESSGDVQPNNSDEKSKDSPSKVRNDNGADGEENVAENTKSADDGLADKNGTAIVSEAKIGTGHQVEDEEKHQTSDGHVGDGAAGNADGTLPKFDAADGELENRDVSAAVVANKPESASNNEQGADEALSQTKKDVKAKGEQVPQLPVEPKKLEESNETDDYLSPIFHHQLLKDILKKHKVKSSTWVKSVDSTTTMITFVVESGRKEEDVLDALVSCGIGKQPGTSVSISPTTVCLNGGQDKHTESKKQAATDAAQPTDTSTKTSPIDREVTPTGGITASTSATDQSTLVRSADSVHVGFTSDAEDMSLLERDAEGGGADIQEIEESDFFKSIKARIIIQPIVATLRHNAEFTFDYLAFVILASMISAVGLIENNSVILVASMLISPLMGPILAGTFGSAVDDPILRNIGIKSEIIGLSICVFTGFVVGLPVTYLMASAENWSPESWPSPEMYSRGLPRSLIIGAVIALVSGMAVALSVLGNNQGSLVGVAISASLLPPAVNCGLLWAHSLQSAIDSLVNADTSPEDVQYSGEGLNCTWIPGNTYNPYFTCNIAQETFYLGLISLLLTLINIGLIIVAAMLCLKVKQVSPRASVAHEQVFWTTHMKVAKHYNTTVRPSTDYWTTMVKELKANLKVTDREAEKILVEGQNARRRTPYDIPEDLLSSPGIQDIGIRPRAMSAGHQSAPHAFKFDRVFSHDPKLESAKFGKKPPKVHQGRFIVEKKEDSPVKQTSEM